MYDENKVKVMFFFWLHSAFVIEPPPTMCGAARELSPDECASEGLAPGTWSLTLSKQEIDRAAKDTRCAHFDPDFRVEVFFSQLPGESGTGPGLEGARAAAAAAAAVGSESATEVVERPLKADRDAYHRHVQVAAAAGRPAMTFLEWLLGADPGPFSGAAAAPASVNGRVSNSDLVFDT